MPRPRRLVPFAAFTTGASRAVGMVGMVVQRSATRPCSSSGQEDLLGIVFRNSTSVHGAHTCHWMATVTHGGIAVEKESEIL